MDLMSKLNKATSGGNKPAASGNLRHENEDAIVNAAVQLLSKSETGMGLLTFAKERRLPIHVLKTKDDYGILPEQNTVYISTPGGQPMPNTRAVIQLAGALRIAQQEETENLRQPNINIGRERWAQITTEKRLDALFVQTAVVYELGVEKNLSEIVDEFVRMGYGNLLEAHRLDLNEGQQGE